MGLFLAHLKKDYRLPMQEMKVPSLGRENPLEKEMATHSSSLAWRIHGQRDRKSTRLNSSHSGQSRMPSSA